MQNEERDQKVNRMHSRTSPEVQFKRFSSTKQQIRPITDNEWIWKDISRKQKKKINIRKNRTDNEWTGKTISKNQIKKQKINAKMPHVNKKLEKKLIF